MPDVSAAPAVGSNRWVPAAGSRGVRRRHADLFGEGGLMVDRLRNFGFLLNEVSRRYVQRFERRANELSMTLPQCRALAYLERNEGISQAKLAELTGLEPMAIVRSLDRMEADGLVERKADPVDRRARALYLTPKAKPALDQIWRMGDLTRAETFSGIPKAERDVFLDVLTRVVANLRTIEDAPVESAPAGEDETGQTEPVRRRIRKTTAG